MIDPLAATRRTFLARGQRYGCAETALHVLQRHFALDDPEDGAAAMALNGGVAYSGGTCGAITGAAMAIGRLSGRRIPDRARAKRVARQLTARVIDDFQTAEGATDCGTLIGVDLRAPGGHEAFIAGGSWRVHCLRRVERVVAQVAPLADRDAWEVAVASLGGAARRGAQRERPGV